MAFLNLRQKVYKCIYTHLDINRIYKSKIRALARKLKLMTFSRNWELLVTRIFFVTTRRMLLSAVPWKKYFKAWYYTTQTNQQWEIFFSLFIINLVGKYFMEINRSILVSWLHASIRSVENCSSLEILNVSMTDLQPIYANLFYAILL